MSLFETGQRLRRGEAPSLLLIHGEERYLARRLLRALRATLESSDTVDYLEWDQDAGASELIVALTTLPLGVSRRLVVARNPAAGLCLP